MAAGAPSPARRRHGPFRSSPLISSRIALQTKCLAQPLRQALHTAGRLGCDGVQLDLRHELPAAELSDTAVRQVRKLLEDLNLRVGPASFPTRGGYATADGLQRRLEATLEAMRAASRLQARWLLVTLGPVSAEQTVGDILHESLSLLASAGNRLGVQVVVQAPGASPSDLTALLDGLAEGLVGVDLSPADLILNGQSPQAYAASLGGRICHVFANDAVPSQGGRGGIDVVLGRGTVDVPELLSALAEHDYRGWITIESRNSRTPEADAANALQFLRAL